MGQDVFSSVQTGVNHLLKGKNHSSDEILLL